nr:histidine kinase 2-like isoform X1 [Ipomoea batatas]
MNPLKFNSCLAHRFKQKRPPPWTAIAASIGVLVITLLLGHIFHAAINRIAKFERDYQKMMDLKHRAEAADIAKSQFLATVSHEIRTPMNGVLGMLQMLMDTNLDATQLEYAQTAHASGKDLISLINEVLDQAKIESGRLELEAVAFDLRAVLDKVLSLCSGRSHEKRIEVLNELASDTCSLCLIHSLFQVVEMPILTMVFIIFLVERSWPFMSLIRSQK